MAVTEKVARLWGKLTGYEIVKGHDAWLYEGHRKGKVPPRDYVPDPAEQPWEWVKALVAAGYVVAVDETQVVISRPEVGKVYEVDAAEDDTPEAALAAAVEKMAEDVR